MYVIYDDMDIVIYVTSSEMTARQVTQRIEGRYEYVPVI